MSLFNQTKRYVQLLLQIVFLSFLEKASQFFVFLLGSLVFVLLSLAGLLFWAFAFSQWLNDKLANPYLGYIIVGFLLYIIALIVFKARKWIFQRYVIRNLIKTFTAHEDKEKE